MKFKPTKMAKEILRKRLSVNKTTLNSMWKQNNRSNDFTTRFMGCMFQDTSMNKQLKKEIVLVKTKHKIGKSLSQT